MAAEPFVFVDRSLGRIAVPRLLREAGIELVTLAEHCGMPQDHDVQDTVWIGDAARNGWIMFMKDERIRRRPAERQAFRDAGARCLCPANGNLSSGAMAQRFIANWPRIVEASFQPGPYLYSVRTDEIARLSVE